MINFDVQNMNKLHKKAKEYGLICGVALLGSVAYLGGEVHADELISAQPTSFQELSENTEINDSAYFKLLDTQTSINIDSENTVAVTNGVTLVEGQPSEVTNSVLNQENDGVTIEEENATDEASKLPSVVMYDEGIKSEGAIKDEEIRQSTHYSATVMTDENGENEQESFVYMSVPRSGIGKVGYDKEDGAEFAFNNGMTQSWTSFTYSTDTWVKIGLLDGAAIRSVDDVIVSPDKFSHFEKKMLDEHTIAIKVPFIENGIRLSVEIKSELMNVYAHDGTWGAQDNNANGADKLVSTEPRHSMIIVANPELNLSDIPTETDGKIQYMEPGRWQEVREDTDILVIKKGLHYMTNKAIAKLDHIRWIYFEDGAYVKGAFDFQSNPKIRKISGYGILSTEQYGYEMSSKTFEYNIAGNEGGGWVDNIKALRFWATDRTMDIVGLTVANPSYHTMVAYGDEEHFKTNFTRFNQFGAWFWQTDAPEVYGGGTMKDCFIMSNDDTFKLYHSNSTYDNIIVWKEENGPVFQWGWTGRNLSNINVSNVAVIHSRMHWNNDNTGLFNSASNFGDGNFGDRFTIDGLHFKNIRFEDRLNTLFRLHENGNLKNVTVDGLYINNWTETNNDGSTSSTIEHEGSGILENLSIANYYVNGELITFENKNWESYQLGRLNFDVKYWGNWFLKGGGLSDTESLKAEQAAFAYWTPFVVSRPTPMQNNSFQESSETGQAGHIVEISNHLYQEKKNQQFSGTIPSVFSNQELGNKLTKSASMRLPKTSDNQKNSLVFSVLGIGALLFIFLSRFVKSIF
ncbi:TPA: family 49 glycosyl hydrolase [Streptococcus suis]